MCDSDTAVAPPAGAARRAQPKPPTKGAARGAHPKPPTKGYQFYDSDDDDAARRAQPKPPTKLTTVTTTMLRQLSTLYVLI